MLGRARWAISLLSTFLTAAGLTFTAASIGPGCQGTCKDQFDCGDQQFCDVPSGRCMTECFTDQDCRSPPECLGNPTACAPRGLRCNSVGRCMGRILAPPETGPITTPIGPDIIDEIGGWDDQPGSGRAFIVDTLAIADQGRGFDVDGRCRGPGDCIDNSLWQLGQLGNDQIRQGLLGGETLLLVELAGIDEPFTGNDRSITVKFYGARDADDPFFPANNFQIPAGETKCCEFKINPQSIAGVPPQARARAPAQIQRGQMTSLAAVPIQFTLTVGVPPHPEIRIEKVLLSGRVPSALNRFSDGMLGGAVPVSTLAQTDNPYCKTLNRLCPRQLPDSTLIDLVASILQPDIDLDIPLDGLERLDVGSNGRIQRCIDGNGLVIAPIPSTAPGWMCTLNPAIADGYSVGIQFTGVAATVVGVGQ